LSASQTLLVFCRLRLLHHHLHHHQHYQQTYAVCRPINATVLPRDAMLARYMLSSCVRLSDRLSVRLSVCHCTKGLNTITQTAQYDRNCSFLMPRISAGRRGGLQSAIFDRYLAIDLSQKRCRIRT